MFLLESEINSQSTVAEIVKQDYRTADIFTRYGIEYCCGGRWPLTTVCLMKGIEETSLINELKKVLRNNRVSPGLSFENWNIDFLVDYIIHVHHAYLEKTLPPLWQLLTGFTTEHAKNYPYFRALQSDFDRFHSNCNLHLKYEEEVIFPYLRQVAHAYEDKEAYAAQLVRTLRKPLIKMMEEEKEIFTAALYQFRNLTGNYTPPDRACTNHRVVLSKLKELDADIAQHMHLENEILFPRIIAMEKALLNE